MKEKAAVKPNHQDPPTTSVCPNCGYLATENYCAHCGQPTHLHKDTFWGLISHFTAHYFHYDSKFWQTLKALVFAPGKLTIAYQQKKRQKYIPPISLYIFVSIVFFLLLPMFQQSLIRVQTGKTPAERHATDSTSNTSIEKTVEAQATKEGRAVRPADRYVSKMGDNILTDLKDHPAEFKERLLHSFPKIFFFMIPLLAALLKLFMIRQKQFYFVDHAVFALHIHSFVFILCLIPLINPFTQIQYLLSNMTLLVCFVYFILAIHRVYKSGWIKTVIIGIGTAAIYFISLLLVALLDLWILFAFKG